MNSTVTIIVTELETIHDDVLFRHSIEKK